MSPATPAGPMLAQTVGLNRLMRATAAYVLVGAVGLAAVRYYVSSPAEGLFAAVSFGAAVAAAAIVAILANRGAQPLLLGGTGLALIVVSGLTVVGFPLGLAGYFWCFLAVRGRQAGRSDGFVPVFAVLALLVASYVSLLVHQDPRSWTTATGGGQDDDIITRFEATVSMGLALAAIAVAWFSAIKQQS